MNRLTAAAIAAALLWPGAGTASANHVASGSTCGFWSVTEPLGEAGLQSGQFSSGPVTAATTPATVTIRCSIQLGTIAHHEGPDSSTVTATGGQTAWVPPTNITYYWDPGITVYLCTEWTVTDASGTATYYYDGANAAFSTSPLVDCVTVVSVTNGPSTTHTSPQVPATV